MKVLITYSDGSQQVQLDDNSIVILSSPYSNGERKILSESGRDIGYLTSEYPNGHKYANMTNGSKYDVSEKPRWFGGSQEEWQKYEQGQNELSQQNNTQPFNAQIDPNDIEKQKDYDNNKGNNIEVESSTKERVKMEVTNSTLNISHDLTKYTTFRINLLNKMIEYKKTKGKSKPDIRAVFSYYTSILEEVQDALYVIKKIESEVAQNKENLDFLMRGYSDECLNTNSLFFLPVDFDLRGETMENSIVFGLPFGKLKIQEEDKKEIYDLTGFNDYELLNFRIEDEVVASELDVLSTLESINYNRKTITKLQKFHFPSDESLEKLISQQCQNKIDKEIMVLNKQLRSLRAYINGEL